MNQKSQPWCCSIDNTIANRTSWAKAEIICLCFLNEYRLVQAQYFCGTLDGLLKDMKTKIIFDLFCLWQNKNPIRNEKNTISNESVSLGSTQKLMRKQLTRIKFVEASVALRVANKAKELNVNNVYKTRDFSELES